MKVQWLGHSAFLLTTRDGLRIVTDPYVAGSYDGAVGYGPIEVRADVVTVSHDHADHNGVAELPGAPRDIRGPGGVDLEPFHCVINGYPTWHDPSGGLERGDNTVFVFDVGGMRVCHAGDLGHELAPELAERIGRVDVLLLPVGGKFTVGAKAAHRVAEQLGARVVIPMHFKTAKLGFDIAPVDDFLAGHLKVKRVGSSEVDVTADTLPQEPEVWVLDHAL